MDQWWSKQMNQLSGNEINTPQLSGNQDDDGSITAMVMVDNLIELARLQLPFGNSAKLCTSCQEEIPEERRKILPGVQHCIYCQDQIENKKVRIRIVDLIL